MTTTHAHYEDTSSDSVFAALGDEQYVSLTTFRKSGERVSTPMWVVRGSPTLLGTSPTPSTRP